MGADGGKYIFECVPFSTWRAGRTAIAPVLKTGVRKDFGVRIPSSPPNYAGASFGRRSSKERRQQNYVPQKAELRFAGKTVVDKMRNLF